jgi:hypothetical protein
MNRKFIPAVAAFIILVTVLGTTPMTFAQTTLAFGPKLEVSTIPQDNQLLKKGIIILGLDTAIGQKQGGARNGAPEFQCVDAATHDAQQALVDAGLSSTSPPPVCGAQDLLSQHKLLVTYNGLVITWRPGTTDVVPLVFCNFLEKDKVNVIPDPKSGDGKQGSWENLMTTMVDVSSHFVCKARWKVLASGLLESAGVLDVYYTGPGNAHYISDTILVVTSSLTVGRTVIFGSDIQDICVIGWAFTGSDATTPSAQDTIVRTDNDGNSANWYITKPDGTLHYIFTNPMGDFVSCDDIALVQRQVLGIVPAPGQDPLATSA